MTRTTLLVAFKDEGPEESFWVDGNSQHLDSVVVIKVRTGCVCYITKHLRVGHCTSCKVYSRKPQCCENEVQLPGAVWINLRNTMCSGQSKSQLILY